DDTSESGGESWSLSMLGIYAGYSYSMESVVSQGVETTSGTLEHSESSDFEGTTEDGAQMTQTGGGSGSMTTDQAGDGNGSGAAVSITLSVSSSGFSSFVESGASSHA